MALRNNVFHSSLTAAAAAKDTAFLCSKFGLVSGIIMLGTLNYKFWPWVEEREHGSMKKFLKYIDRFDSIFPSHGSIPIEPEIIPKLIEDAEQILKSKAEGNSVVKFGMKVVLYRFEKAGFLCDE